MDEEIKEVTDFLRVGGLRAGCFADALNESGLAQLSKEVETYRDKFAEKLDECKTLQTEKGFNACITFIMEELFKGKPPPDKVREVTENYKKCAIKWLDMWAKGEI